MEPERDAATWHREGNQHFRDKNYQNASACYGKALELLDNGTGAYPDALLNLSATHLKLQHAEAALCCAAAALAFNSKPASVVDDYSANQTHDSTNSNTAARQSKAYYRMALALDQLGLTNAARCSMQQAIQNAGNTSQAVAKLWMSQLKEQHGRFDPTTGTEDTLRALASCKIPATPSCTPPPPPPPPSSSSSSSSSSSAETTSSACISRCLDSKQAGNESFRAHEYTAALQCYSQALQQLQPLPAVALLNNRAICHLHQGGTAALQQALQDATAALALDPHSEKAHHRRASALLQLGWLPQAADACAQASQLLPSSSTSIAALAKEVAAASASSSSRPKRDLTERQMRQMERAGTVGVEEQSLVNSMLEGMMSSVPGLADSMGKKGVPQLLDQRVPPFHEEFAKAGRWPAEADRAACKKVLLSAYERARGSPMHEYVFTGKKPATEVIRPVDVVKRLGTTDPAAYDWLSTAAAGEVAFRQPSAYSSNIYSSFGNVPRRKEVLDPGRTHVEVGFLDLAALAAGCMLLPDGGRGISSSEPLRWVGYDSSAYAVAKALVVGEMMRQGAEVDHVLQVWYSAAWTKATLGAFRDAVAAILSSSSSSSPMQPAVVRLLQHWHCAEVSLAVARQGWLSSVDGGRHIADFKYKADRLALCEYLLTGQLLGGEMGSVAMFAVPQEHGNRSLDENFLQTLDLSELVQLRATSRAPDAIAAGVALLRERIGRLAGLVQTGRVTIEVRRAAVQPSNKAVVAEISALQPWTINWSNICDYMLPKDFHAMARACSCPGGDDTVHMLHSMNWPYYVKQASYVDLVMESGGQDLRPFVAGAKQSVELMQRVLGHDRLLLSPPVDTAKSLVDYMLANMHHKGWAAAFVKAAGFANPKLHIGDLQGPQYVNLSRAHSTIHLTYTYDPEMVFPGSAYMLWDGLL